MTILFLLHSHAPKKLESLVSSLHNSLFARNAFYLTGITGIERVAALVQAILLARILGITEFGIYGLLFSTVGLVSSVAGLQMGLTATVFVARYRSTDKARAGAVIRYVMRFAIIVGGLFLLATVPFAVPLSVWLFKSTAYHITLILGSCFVVMSLSSGVQDGIAEGFEDFRSVANARLVATIFTLLAIYPAAVHYGLDGALAVLLVGAVLKYITLGFVVASHRHREAIPKRGGDVSFVRLVKDFSLPSMLASLIYGSVMWFGMYLLSRQPAGLEAVATVNVGVQWQGPITLVTGTLGRVAVPVFSRQDGGGDLTGLYRLKRKLLRLTGIAVVVVVSVLIACGDLILSLYGRDFHAGWGVFSVLMASAIPKVLADVHMQALVGRGFLWRQLLLYALFVLTMVGCFLLMISRWNGLGYAISIFAASLVFWLSAILADWRLSKKNLRY